MEVFGKGADFDPSQDSMVRVYAHNLRQKLDHYYATDGAASRSSSRSRAANTHPCSPWVAGGPEPAVEPLRPQRPRRRRPSSSVHAPRGWLALAAVVLARPGRRDRLRGRHRASTGAHRRADRGGVADLGESAR